MKKKFTRLTAFLIIVLLVFSILISRLIQLQVINGDYYSEIAEAMGEKPKVILAPRGEILDTNLKKIATNRLGYSIVYTAPNKKPTSDELNNTIIDALNIIYKHNEQDKIVTTSMPVNYDFSTKEISLKTKSEEKLDFLKYAKSISQKNSLNASFDLEYSDEMIASIGKSIEDLKDKNDKITDEEINKIEAGKIPSFNEKNAAKEIFYRLAEKYGLGTILDQGNMTFNSKFGLNGDKLYYAVSLRYNLKTSEFKQYEDIDLAKNISKETAWEFQIKNTEMAGISAQIVPIRYYPYGEVGSAFLGYLGKISNPERYERLGYDISRELVGVNNLEYTLENRENNDMDIQLRGEPGIKYLKVDKFGKIIEETGNIEPVPGDTVVTSINMDMQKAAEKALDDVMARIRMGPSGGISDKSYPSYRGAVVAMNVHTGEILALASRPGFNPNDFAETGRPSDPLLLEKYQLTNEAKKRVDVDSRTNDVIPIPMFNYATLGAVPPGSTFKPFTAIAGLETGVITKDTYVYDKTLYPTGGKPIKCWIYGKGSHGLVNVTGALKVSCNYFFNTVGDRLGDERFSEWARKFGLARDEYGKRPRTGIEITERPGVIGTPDEIRRIAAASIMSKLVNQLGEAANGGYLLDPGHDDYTEVYNMLIDGVFDEAKLYDIGITNKNAKARIKEALRRMTSQAKRPNEVLYMAMGQGMVSLTPVQMTQYISTIVNGGTRYKAHLVKKVLNPDGTVKKEIQPEVLNQLNLDPKNIATVMEGMGRVTEEEGGTGRKVFGAYPVKTGGKTGTAQPGNTENPLRANYAWFVGFAPLQNPEIAIAVAIYDGGHGGYAAYVARDVYDAYFKDHPYYKNDPAMIKWLANKNAASK